MSSNRIGVIAALRRAKCIGAIIGIAVGGRNPLINARRHENKAAPAMSMKRREATQGSIAAPRVCETNDAVASRAQEDEHVA